MNTLVSSVRQICLALIFLPCWSALADSHLEDAAALFARDAEFESVEISPGGDYLAVIYLNEGMRSLAVFDRKTMKAISNRRFPVPNEIGHIAWVNDERLVITAWSRKKWQDIRYGTGNIFAVNADGSRQKLIFGPEAENVALTNIKRREASYAGFDIIDMLDGDDRHILIASYPWVVDGGYWRYRFDTHTEAYKLNVYSGSKTKVDVSPLVGSDFLTDRQGRVRLTTAIDKHYDQQVLIRNNNSEWEPLPVELDGGRIVPESFSEDGKSLFFQSSLDTDLWTLQKLDLETGERQVLYQHKQFDLADVYQNYYDQSLTGVSVDTGRGFEYHYLDKEHRDSKTHRMLKKAFAGHDFTIQSSTRDGSIYAVRVSSDKNAGDFYLFDRNSKRAEYLFSRKQWLDLDRMASVETHDIHSRDGTPLQVFLTLPAGSEGRKLPFVVMPHGGPYGVRDSWRFDSEAQFIASQGYGVLQVNFRGSGGYGRNFVQSGYRQWGGIMQDDVTDATRWLLEGNRVDEGKICISGGSYGGYAALMGLVKEPDLYRCGIGFAGVYDLALKFSKSDIPDMYFGKAFLNVTQNNDEQEKLNQSPAHNAMLIKAPVLLVHGGKDERVPIVQGKRMKKALEKAGKSVEWLEFPMEGHGLAREEHREQYFRRIASFLERNIGGTTLAQQ